MPNVMIDEKKIAQSDAEYLFALFGGKPVGFRMFVDYPEKHLEFDYLETTEYEIKSTGDVGCELAKLGTRCQGSLTFYHEDEGAWTLQTGGGVGLPNRLLTLSTTGPSVPTPQERMTNAEYQAWCAQLRSDGHTLESESFGERFARARAEVGGG